MANGFGKMGSYKHSLNRNLRLTSEPWSFQFPAKGETIQLGVYDACPKSFAIRQEWINHSSCALVALSVSTGIGSAATDSLQCMLYWLCASRMPNAISQQLFTGSGASNTCTTTVSWAGRASNKTWEEKHDLSLDYAFPLGNHPKATVMPQLLKWAWWTAA